MVKETAALARSDGTYGVEWNDRTGTSFPLSDGPQAAQQLHCLYTRWCILVVVGCGEMWKIHMHCARARGTTPVPRAQLKFGGIGNSFQLEIDTPYVFHWPPPHNNLSQ